MQNLSQNSQTHDCPNGGTCIYFKQVSKEIEELKTRVEKNETGLSEVREDLTEVKIGQRENSANIINLTSAINSINATLIRMDAKFDKLDEKIETKFTSLDTKMDTQNKELWDKLESVQNESKQSTKELSDKIEQVRTESKQSVKNITEPWKKIAWNIAEKILYACLVSGFGFVVYGFSKGIIKF